MAINGVNKKKAATKVSASSTFNKPASSNPPAFVATGKGLANKLPDYPATALNANASIVNQATSKSNDDLYKMYLFVNAVETEWNLAGETGQGQMGRVFYPRNLTQGIVTIEGAVANQYEYDRLTRFIAHHHYSQMSPQGAVAQSLDGNNYPGVIFTMFKPSNQKTFDGFQPLRYLLAITQMQAGHQQFQFFPTFSLTCTVLYDYLETKAKLEQDIKATIQMKAVFGDASNPSPLKTSSSQPSTTTTK